MSYRNFELQASAVQTGPSNSGAVSIPAASMLELDVKVTAQTALTALSIWLEGSNDGETTWFELPADYAYKNEGSVAAAVAPRQGVRNVVDNESGSGAVAQYTGIYKHIAAEKIRLRWFIAGTNVTFSAKVGAK